MTQSAWEYEKAPGLPKYQPIERLPWSAMTLRRRRPMSAIASSHETCSNVPSSRRRSGCVTRSGSFCTSVIAMPFGQASPCDSGWSLSGRSFVTTPSSTVATMPQAASQIRQKVTR